MLAPNRKSPKINGNEICPGHLNFRPVRLLHQLGNSAAAGGSSAAARLRPARVHRHFHQIRLPLALKLFISSAPEISTASPSVSAPTLGSSTLSFPPPRLLRKPSPVKFLEQQKTVHHKKRWRCRATPDPPAARNWHTTPTAPAAPRP